MPRTSISRPTTRGEAARAPEGEHGPRPRARCAVAAVTGLPQVEAVAVVERADEGAAGTAERHVVGRVEAGVAGVDAQLACSSRVGSSRLDHHVGAEPRLDEIDHRRGHDEPGVALVGDRFHREVEAHPEHRGLAVTASFTNQRVSLVARSTASATVVVRGALGPR